MFRVLFCCAAAGCLLLAATPVGAGELGPAAERIAVASETRAAGEAVALAKLQRARVRREAGEDRIAVILEPRPGRHPRDLDDASIAALGGRVEARSRSFVRVWVAPRRLRALAGHPDVALVRLPAIPQAQGFGSIESESVALTRADELQAAGYSGAGVRAAVVDLGFNNLDATILAGELPASTVVVTLPGQSAAYVKSGDKHGVGVAEQLVDMAPGVDLYVLRTDDEVDFQNAGDYLATHGIDVAVHSVGWTNFSYYDDTGPISAVVNDLHDNYGVFWVNSAGNSAHMHWRGPWTDDDGNRLLEFEPGVEQLAINGTTGEVCIFLNWDQYGQSADNLDLYIVNGLGQRFTSSTNAQIGAQDPEEWLCFQADSEVPPFAIEVERARNASPPAGLDLTLFSFYNGLSPFVREASFMDPAPAHGSYTVCAIAQDVYADPSPSPRGFSSRGPTNDGRMKPDLCAPDGTSSLNYGTAVGTSFSAPVVAGAAALLLELNPGLGPDALATWLDSLALDTFDAGWDGATGYGRLMLGVFDLPQCSDGFDNDGDGAIDLADPGCGGDPNALNESPQCNDGVDNDNDGYIDLADPGCNGDPTRRESPACGLGFELAPLGALLLLRRRRRRSD